MPRALPFCIVLQGLISLTGCIDSAHSQPTAAKFTTGFWYWDTSSGSNWKGAPLDTLFVQVGKFSAPQEEPFGGRLEGWRIYGSFPNKLPDAREYWIVYRYEQQGVPDLTAVTGLANSIIEVASSAKSNHRHVVGVQLDIDSPTASLPRYAVFLREVRKAIPREMQISITGLLDWFRAGTAIADVIKEVDEFVPQFYDLKRQEDDVGIASTIDAVRWGPVFNRFRKRFRIGVSTFGRSRILRRVKETGNGVRAYYYRDLLPLNVATNPAFQLQTSRSAAGELVLNYKATKNTRIEYNDFNTGDTMQFTLASPEAIQSATQSVRKIGGYVAGVLFFRWPNSEETLVMQPEEVLIAAGVGSSAGPLINRIQTVNGRCAAVHCADLYLESAKILWPSAIRYRIRLSTDLEYFLPDKNVLARMTGPALIELEVPAYCGRRRIYLGRAVTSQVPDFTVEEVQ